MLHCKFSGDYNSERIFKIGQYLTKLCVEHLGFTFLAHVPVNCQTCTLKPDLCIEKWNKLNFLAPLCPSHSRLVGGLLYGGAAYVNTYGTILFLLFPMRH